MKNNRAPKAKTKKNNATAHSVANAKAKADPDLVIDDPVIDEPLPEHGAVLVIDIGGTSFKMMVSGEMTPRTGETGKNFTPVNLVEQVTKLAEDWHYDCITIGFPGPVGQTGPSTEPGNLGDGWIGFNFTEAFGKPVKIVNDAVMQALGSYEGGRMLFLGLGTGIGAAFIGPKVILPLEVGSLRYSKKHTLGDMLGQSGLERVGKKKWRVAVVSTAKDFIKAFLADHVVIGGGNARHLDQLSHGIRKGHNHAAFRGGLRAWAMDGLTEQSVDRVDLQKPGWHIV